MKIEQLIVQHLYISKKVSLQGIGTIHLNPSVALPTEGDKDFVMPENAITFDYDLKAPEDISLINFIVEKTRKIKPLATSDLESYSMLAKQFLNIGKPLEIEGVGTIQKNQAGIYEFIPGNFITPRIEESPKELRSKAEEVVSFESEARTNNVRRNLLIGVGLLLLIMGGLGIYYFFFFNKPVIQEMAEPPVAQTQIVQDTVAKIDTSSQQKIIDSSNLAKPVEPIKTDSINFRIVVKEYKSQEIAKKRLEDLTLSGHKLEMIMVDSAKYRLVMAFKTPLSDTTKVKDSLRVFFGGHPFVLQK